MRRGVDPAVGSHDADLHQRGDAEREGVLLVGWRGLLVAKFLLCVGVNHLSEAQGARELAGVNSPRPELGPVEVGAVGLSRAHECQVKQKMQTK